MGNFRLQIGEPRRNGWISGHRQPPKLNHKDIETLNQEWVMRLNWKCKSLVRCSSCCDQAKTSDGSGDTVHVGREGMVEFTAAGPVAFPIRKQIVNSSVQLAFSWMQSEPSAHGMAPPTFLSLDQCHPQPGAEKFLYPEGNSWHKEAELAEVLTVVTVGWSSLKRTFISIPQDSETWAKRMGREEHCEVLSAGPL